MRGGPRLFQLAINALDTSNGSNTALERDLFAPLRQLVLAGEEDGEVDFRHPSKRKTGLPSGEQVKRKIYRKNSIVTVRPGAPSPCSARSDALCSIRSVLGPDFRRLEFFSQSVPGKASRWPRQIAFWVRTPSVLVWGSRVYQVRF